MTPLVVYEVQGTEPVFTLQQFGGNVAKVSVVGSDSTEQLVHTFSGPDHDEVPLLVAEQLFLT